MCWFLSSANVFNLGTLHIIIGDLRSIYIIVDQLLLIGSEDYNNNIIEEECTYLILIYNI